MPETLPQFSSQPLGEEAPKKKLIRRRAPARRPRLRAAEPKLKAEVANQLASIYRDDKGRLPDMKKIKMQGQRSVVETFFGLIILGGLLAAAAWAGFFLLPAANRVSDSQIKLDITGPTAVALGSTNTYKITFENQQSVKLGKTTLTVYYPEGFSFLDSSIPADNSGHTEWNLGVIGAHQKTELTITGKSYGALDKDASWRVFLKYQPENFNSVLQKVTTFTTTINQSPFTLEISGPDKAAIGDEIGYTIKLKSANNLSAQPLILSPAWPSNFHLTTSTPSLVKNNWAISSSTPEMIFVAKGKFSDLGNATSSLDNSSQIGATLYLQPANNSEQKFTIAESSLKTELIKNALNLNLAINGTLNNFSASPGKDLNITINAKNASPTILTKATVQLILDAPSSQKQSMLNWANLTDKNDGTVKGQQVNENVRRGTISWDSQNIASLAELRTGDEINIDLNLPIKTIDKFNIDPTKNYPINASALITFTDINGKTQTVSSNPITITLDSDLTLDVQDKIVTTADSKEQHNISWILNNNFHPLKNVMLDADIYGDISWQAPNNIPAGEIKFDPKTKHISWTIPEMPTSVDVLALPLQILLNSKNPTQQTLVSKVKVQAFDTITQETIQLTGDEISLNALAPTKQ